VEAFMIRLDHRARRLVRLAAVVLALPLALGACGKSIGDTIDDATITARVKTALLNAPNVSAMEIHVSTTDGVVMMSGLVSSRGEEQRAIQVARAVPGVKGVRSTLEVKGAG
jgi:hyperosmotically inducible protein